MISTKFEARNSKQITNSKLHSLILDSFGFRVSDFEFTEKGGVK